MSGFAYRHKMTGDGGRQIVQAVELCIAEAAGAEPESPAWAPGENPWRRTVAGNPEA